MSEQTTTIISKVWGMCGPLRDDGVSYGDYLEQLTYLIFLKMSDEYAKPPYKRQTGIPEGCGWADMSDLKGAELEEKYKSILETLGEQGGTLGKIFKGATNKINNAAILYRIVQMIDKEKWVSMSTDVKGEIYEGLLQKNAEDVKSGAGQYFTPRPFRPWWSVSARSLRRPLPTPAAAAAAFCWRPRAIWPTRSTTTWTGRKRSF